MVNTAQKNKNYINGQWISCENNQTYEQRNPADISEVTGVWQLSSRTDTQAAIDAALEAFSSWSSLTVYERANYLKRALALMHDQVDQIAQIITAENGKTLKESHQEINSAIKEMDFQISEGLRLGGDILPTERDGCFAYTKRRPLGPVSIIAPWNFPFNVPCRKITPALMAGNTCLLKPAQLTPGVGAIYTRLLAEANLPPGVLNFITGKGSVVGEELVTNPAIKAISFTGSTEVGMGINKKAAGRFTRTQLEMGGKNPLVILADADLERAADAAALAAFACSGQWCTSTSRAVVDQKVFGDFLDLLLERIKKIKVGRGTDTEATMGPVCGQGQLKGILAAIEKGKAEGARLLLGGNQVMDHDFDKGCFIEPTIFSEVKPEMSIAQEEIFGPVLAVMKVASFEQAIETANAVDFGLCSSIFTRDLRKAMQFVDKTDVGITHVNLPTAVKEPQFSFGGVKLSGHGIPEGGKSGLEFFTEHKTVYVDYT